MRSVVSRLGIAGVLFLVGLPASSGGERLAEIEAALSRLDLSQWPAADTARQKNMLGQLLRRQLAQANESSTQSWRQIETRAAWESFRQQVRAKLARSLSRSPFAPGQPTVVVTKSLPGDGFRIENLLVQPNGRLPISANLYVPDPPRSKMPGIVISHSHHHPKHEGELQDMGMTWARAGCYVLVPDHLGHGERRQHPFHTAEDFAGQFAVGRQDYYFRYDLSIPLYLVGESLLGWLAHDLMSCVDVLLQRPGIDPHKIALLGSVAGGGDPAAVTAALDERIAAVVPFNFGGPQPESPYPLPADAETTFSYAGSGSWESTRNPARSAAEGFLPWAVCGSLAPRALVHAHEFAWDRARDPVWKRYQKIWQWYDAEDRLAFAHGHGTLSGQDPPGSHCNNIGAVQRLGIHEAFRRWLGIQVTPNEEYSRRRSREELLCWSEPSTSDAARRSLSPLLHEWSRQLRSQREEARRGRSAEQLREAERAAWTRLLGDTNPASQVTIAPPAREAVREGEITVEREWVTTEPGVTVPVVTLARYEPGDLLDRSRHRVVALGVAADGLQRILERRRSDIAQALSEDILVVLTEVRGTGTSSPGEDRGPQGGATAWAATHLMLGRPILSGQVRDMRTVWKQVRSRLSAAKRPTAVVLGGSGVVPLASELPFSYPRRISQRPPECQPTGALLAALLTLYESSDCDALYYHRGLASYQSVLDSPFVQVPLEAIVPGMLGETDIPQLISALQDKSITVSEPLDGRGRLVPRQALEFPGSVQYP